MDDTQEDGPIKLMRVNFGKLRRNACYVVSKETWMAEVKKELMKLGVDEKIATPEQWVEAAEKATVKCPDCHNGIYYWGACVNGRMTHSGQCVRCAGKGRQDQSDFKRNWYYDNHCRRVT